MRLYLNFSPKKGHWYLWHNSVEMLLENNVGWVGEQRLSISFQRHPNGSKSPVFRYSIDYHFYDLLRRWRDEILTISYCLRYRLVSVNTNELKFEVFWPCLNFYARFSDSRLSPAESILRSMVFTETTRQRGSEIRFNEDKNDLTVCLQPSQYPL